jgi:hypothetical protein
LPRPSHFSGPRGSSQPRPRSAMEVEISAQCPLTVWFLPAFVPVCSGLLPLVLVAVALAPPAVAPPLPVVAARPPFSAPLPPGPVCVAQPSGAVIAEALAAATGLSATGIAVPEVAQTPGCHEPSLGCLVELRNEEAEKISSEVINLVQRVTLPDSCVPLESGPSARLDIDFPVARGFAASLLSVVAPAHPACTLQHCQFPQVPRGYRREMVDLEAPCWGVLPHHGLRSASGEEW